jgi:hypothetical protein
MRVAWTSCKLVSKTKPERRMEDCAARIFGGTSLKQCVHPGALVAGSSLTARAIFFGCGAKNRYFVIRHAVRDQRAVR